MKMQNLMLKKQKLMLNHMKGRWINIKNKQQSFIDAQNNIKQQETQKTGKFAKAAQNVKQKGKKQSVGKTRSR